MESTYTESALMKAIRDFSFVERDTRSDARKALDEALKNFPATQADLPALFRDMTGSDKNPHTSPLDIAVELQTLKKASVLDTLLKNGGLVRRWPKGVYVYGDYPIMPLFPPPENHYVAELPGLLDATNGENRNSYSSKQAGYLLSSAGSQLHIFHAKGTVKSGLFILYKATPDEVGQFGSVTFSPKVGWNTTSSFRNHEAFFFGTQNTATSIELTVDEYNPSTNTFEPLANYESRHFPINSYEGFAEVNRQWEDTGLFRTGELAHSFLARSGVSYRLGVITRVDISHTVSDRNGKLPVEVNANFYGMISANIPSITLQTQTILP
ncbi:hypothetical protein [Spirosoma spitsbergense]|uniref:hypothetical protein n=1 Tax=Spirosoma spitsbergense TaxID=431554 RepID=UPI00036EF7E7|nr:hypothetical protein [Spirosoma spitsbergense]